MNNPTENGEIFILDKIVFNSAINKNVTFD